MMFGTKNDNAEKAKIQQNGVKRVREWLENLLPEEEKDEEDGGKAPPGKETSVIVNQLACKEEGCPDVEVVLTLLRAKPRPKLMFKIYKAAAELSSEEVEEAMQKALAEEAKEHEVQTSEAKEHDHGHNDAKKDHAHGHDDAKKDHAHGHDEHGHGPGCGHDDCCGHDHGHSDGQHKDEDHSHEHGHAS